MPKLPDCDLRYVRVSNCTPDQPREGILWFRGYIVTIFCVVLLGALIIVKYN